MMEFLLSVSRKMKHKKEPYTFNLFHPNKGNGHLATIGCEGSGKTHFFRELIKQEHEQYPSITSFIMNQKGIEEYQEVWKSDDKVRMHQVGEYTINPFDCCYEDKSDTIHKISLLLHSISKSLFIQWTEQHNEIAQHYLELLLHNFEESLDIPTMHDLYLLVKENADFTKQKGLLQVLDVCATLELMENDELPLKRMFNGMTDIPCYDEVEFVYVDGNGILTDYLAPYSALLFEHLYLVQRFGLRQDTHKENTLQKHKIAFYQDGYSEFHEDPCYKNLTLYVSACSRPMHLGLRMSFREIGELQNISKILNVIAHLFIQRTTDNFEFFFPPLSERIKQMIQNVSVRGEGVFYSQRQCKGILLDPYLKQNSQ